MKVKFMMFLLCIMDYELDECDSTNTKQIIQHGNTNIAANLAKKDIGQFRKYLLCDQHLSIITRVKSRPKCAIRSSWIMFKQCSNI